LETCSIPNLELIGSCNPIFRVAEKQYTYTVD